MKLKLKDTIQVTLGKDAGKTGEITKVYPKTNKVSVKGINQYKRHLKPQEGFEGGIITRERPILVSKLALLCPSCHQPTRVGIKLDQAGAKTRICKKCKSNLDQKVSAPKKSKK